MRNGKGGYPEEPTKTGEFEVILRSIYFSDFNQDLLEDLNVCVASICGQFDFCVAICKKMDTRDDIVDIYIQD